MTAGVKGSQVVPQLILLVYFSQSLWQQSVCHSLHSLLLREVSSTPGTDCLRVETRPCRGGGDGMGNTRWDGVREHLCGI